MAQENKMNPFSGINPIVSDSPNKAYNPEEPMWESLIGKIIDGKVIPIIGPDFLTDGVNINLLLIRALANQFNVTSTPLSFSELVYDENYLKNNNYNKNSVYTWINRYCCGYNDGDRFIRGAVIEPSQLLVKLIETKLFPFIITTSFMPIVEQTMEKVWGKDLKVLTFNNNPSENNDINNASDLNKPTVYYMFGKVGDTRPHRYVVTDQDMLDFCSSWLSSEDSRKPYILIRELKDKFLLMLGIDYSDWLFRFIWYSVRKESELMSENNDMISNNVELEDSFRKFMLRNKTYLKNNPEEVVRQIKERMDRQYVQNHLLKNKIMNRIVTKFSYPEEKTDIFISYSRRDIEFTEKLYDALTQKGFNVWYDKNNLTDGGKFLQEIKQAIKTTKFFVPILSHNVEDEKNEDHVYRYEWDIAVEVHVGRTFIIPVSEKNFDFYHSGVNDKIQSHNAILYESADDIDTIAEKISIKYNSIKF